MLTAIPIQHWLEHQIYYPNQQRSARPLLLIHGAWHGAWCWDSAAQDFAGRGFVVHSMSLRGHGKSSRIPLYHLCRLNHYLADLHTAISQISPTPIVIGHSMGGFLLQHYLQHHSLPGAVLLCAIPPTGSGPFLLRWAMEHPLAALKALLTLNNYYLVGPPQLARAAFFRPDLPPAQLAEYSAQLGSEPLFVALDTIIKQLRPSPSTTPTLAIAAERDAVFTLDEQQQIAKSYQIPLQIIPKASHDLMLDPAWPQAAELIEQFCQGLAKPSELFTSS